MIDAMIGGPGRMAWKEMARFSMKTMHSGETNIAKGKWTL